MKIMSQIIDYIPTGYESAIPRKEILEQMSLDGIEISDREFRRQIKSMVNDKKELICSTSHRGYYIPKDAEDIEINIREIDSRIGRLSRCKKAIKLMAIDKGIL